MKKLIFLILFNVQFGFLWSQPQCRIDYQNWNLVFEDNFDTYQNVSELSRYWDFYYPWPDGGRTLVANDEIQYYDMSNVTLLNGNLYLTTSLLPSPIQYTWTDYQGVSHSKQLNYKSGMLFFNKEFDPPDPNSKCNPLINGFTYGLFEIRCKLPYGISSFPAFWLYSGATEIDIFEGGGENFSFTSSVIDHSKTPKELCNMAFIRRNFSTVSDEFHTYSAAWTPTTVTFYFDGIETYSQDRLPTSNCPASIIVNLAVWGWATGNTPASLTVDYIKVYKRENNIGFSNCNLNPQCGTSIDITNPKCEVDDYTLLFDVYGEGDLVASNSIRARGVTIYSGSNIKFRAGNRIDLLPNFEVQSGASFEATIGDCSYDLFFGKNSQSLISEKKDGKSVTNFKVYPNPASSNIAVEIPSLSENQTATFSMYNLLGELILSDVFTDKQNMKEINTAALESGIYFYRFHSGEFNEQGKIVITK